MPNTLAHLGIQSLATKALNPTADIKWIGLGCVIPDLPWITQRVVALLVPSVDPLYLRVYCMIQASLFFCMFLCAAISQISRNRLRVFLILAGNSFGHLLLDAMQNKWANGVHLAAPFSWQLSQYHLFWPESWVTVSLTVCGIISMVWFGWRNRRYVCRFRCSREPVLLCILLLISYFLLPFAFFSGPFGADNHYVRTLQQTEQRSGRAIGFDRCRFDSSTALITIFTGEKMKLIADQQIETGTISLLGEFSDTTTIVARTVHQHGTLRDYFSYVGLSIVLFLWGVAYFFGRIRFDS